MTIETSLRSLENGFARLVSEEVENGQDLNFQTWSQRGQKLASETSLRRLENGLARLVSEG